MWKAGKEEKDGRSACGLGGFAAEGDFDGLGVEAGRESGFQLGENRRRQVDVVGLARGFIVEMGVRSLIWAVAGGAALEVDGAHQVAVHKGFEAVVNRGQRDRRHFGFYSGKDFVGRRVIAFFQQTAINDFALGSSPQAALSEGLRKGLGWDWVVGGHERGKVNQLEWF